MRTNEGIVDRGLRTIAGVALLVTGFVFVQGTAGAVIGIIGIVPLATGISGYCPLYGILGISTVQTPHFTRLHPR
jgi:hypothetical protein